MANSPEHCPFLNRADERCARHFSLNQLQYAFRYCFGDPAACPVHAELTAEQRPRRAPARKVAHEPRVQLTIASRYHQRTADPQGVPAVPGV